MQSKRELVCEPSPRSDMPPTADGRIAVLAVRGSEPSRRPVIELDRPVCLIVANVVSGSMLVRLEEDARRAQAETSATAALLEQAERALIEGLKVGQDAQDAALEKRVSSLAALLKSQKGRLNEAVAALQTATQDVELVLFLDGMPTPARAFAASKAEPQGLRFMLDPRGKVDADSTTDWRRILGGLLSGGSRQVTVGIGRPEASRPSAEWEKGTSGSLLQQAVLPVVAGQQTPFKLTSELRIFTPRIAWLAGAGFALLLVSLLFAGRNTSLLRDGDASTAYSLASIQLAFWTIASVFGFTFIWVVTGLYNGIMTEAVLMLLGISAATKFAAKAVDANAIPRVSSNSFWRDIISDGTGHPQLHRIQIAIWTVVLGVIFLWNIFDELILTDFDPNLLFLLGVVSGAYAGLKTQEA